MSTGSTGVLEAANAFRPGFRQMEDQIVSLRGRNSPLSDASGGALSVPAYTGPACGWSLPRIDVPLQSRTDPLQNGTASCYEPWAYSPGMHPQSARNLLKTAFPISIACMSPQVLCALHDGEWLQWGAYYLSHCSVTKR